jgi:hypothetical protein
MIIIWSIKKILMIVFEISFSPSSSLFSSLCEMFFFPIQIFFLYRVALQNLVSICIFDYLFFKNFYISKHIKQIFILFCFRKKNTGVEKNNDEWMLNKKIHRSMSSLFFYHADRNLSSKLSMARGWSYGQHYEQLQEKNRLLFAAFI